MSENAKVRKDLGGKVSPEELRAIKILLLKKEIAQQNVKNSQFPPGTPPQTQAAFYKAAMELFSESKFEEDEWWKAVIISRGLQGINVFVDTDHDGELYTMVDPAQLAPPPPPPREEVPVEPLD